MSLGRTQGPSNSRINKDTASAHQVLLLTQLKPPETVLMEMLPNLTAAYLQSRARGICAGIAPRSLARLTSVAISHQHI